MLDDNVTAIASCKQFSDDLTAHLCEETQGDATSGLGNGGRGDTSEVQQL